MKTLYARIKLVSKKQMTLHLFRQLLFMDFGRWLFKKAMSCQRCGCSNVSGYMNGGLYCDGCFPVIKNWGVGTLNYKAME